MIGSIPRRILILCTGNSARSILAEYLLRDRGKGRFETCSAGSNPTGRVNPFALTVLREKYGIDASDARSKSWDEFRDGGIDCVITVCDNAKESCPLWPGHPLIAHWSSPDPAGVVGSDDEKQAAFERVAAQILSRIDALCALGDAELNAALPPALPPEASPDSAGQQSARGLHSPAGLPAAPAAQAGAGLAGRRPNLICVTPQLAAGNVAAFNPGNLNGIGERFVMDGEESLPR